MSFIEFREVERDYQVGDGIIRAVRKISFALEKGDFTVILGQSGAGKSTVLNLLGGMDSPTSGAIIIDGQDIAAMDDRALTEYRRNKIGFVFQFYNLVPNLTALENVQLAKEICAKPLDAGEILGRVGLSERQGNFPSQLSGGEQQRVSIARALAKNPDILLCDEPTGALDSETGRKVLKLIQEIGREMNKTVIVVTHNAALAAMADRILHMRDGEIYEDTTNSQPQDVEAIQW